MRVTLGELRRVIREQLILREVGANNSWPGQPMRNALSPDVNHREQLGKMSNKGMDCVGDEDGLPEHLREPTVDPDECLGPVPPEAECPGVYADPYAMDTSPLPTGNIKR